MPIQTRKLIRFLDFLNPFLPNIKQNFPVLRNASVLLDDRFPAALVLGKLEQAFAAVLEHISSEHPYCRVPPHQNRQCKQKDLYTGIISISIGINSNNKMLNKTAFEIMEPFFYSGLNRVQAGNIIRKTGYDFKTVKKYLNDLAKLDLITEKNDLSLPTYEANYRNKYFLALKREKIVDDIFLSGLPKYLNKELGETACILFGSCARGDYYEDSDIDIFVQSENLRLDTAKFEKKLKRKINLLFEKRWQDLTDGLKTGLLNDGVSINGRLTV
jgi:predicted nucleotidyltransferase